MLWGPLAGKRGPQEWLATEVLLNGKAMWVLLDTGCGGTFIQRAAGLCILEVLMVKCIHGDVGDYKMKVVTLVIEGHESSCRVGVMPQLECPMFPCW